MIALLCRHACAPPCLPICLIRLLRRRRANVERCLTTPDGDAINADAARLSLSAFFSTAMPDDNDAITMFDAATVDIATRSAADDTAARDAALCTYIDKMLALAGC